MGQGVYLFVVIGVDDLTTCYWPSFGCLGRGIVGFFVSATGLRRVHRTGTLNMLSNMAAGPSLVTGRNVGKIRGRRGRCVRVYGVISKSIDTRIVTAGCRKVVGRNRRLTTLGPRVMMGIPYVRSNVGTVGCFDGGKVHAGYALIFSTKRTLLTTGTKTACMSPFINELSSVYGSNMKLITRVMRLCRACSCGARILTTSVQGALRVLRYTRIKTSMMAYPLSTVGNLLGRPLASVKLRGFLTSCGGIGKWWGTFSHRRKELFAAVARGWWFSRYHLLLTGDQVILFRSGWVCSFALGGVGGSGEACQRERLRCQLFRWHELFFQ